MILQMRICVPAELTALVAGQCEQQAGTAEVAVHAGASVLPKGDVIVAYVAREAVEELLEKLHALNVESRGSVAVSAPELVLSERADRAEEAAPGEGAEFIIRLKRSAAASEESSSETQVAAAAGASGSGKVHHG